MPNSDETPAFLEALWKHNSKMSGQSWTPPPPPGYSYPTAPPPNGYYAAPGTPLYTQPSPSDGYYQYQYAPHNQAYTYNPYAFAPPPQQEPQYVPPPVQWQQNAQAVVEYTFVREGNDGWHVYDPHRALIFDVTYKKAPMFKHDGCEVHHGEGGPLLATVYDEKLTAARFSSPVKRSSAHGQKVSFSDPHARTYAFREYDTSVALLIYPSKEPVAQGTVNLATGKGSLKITDLAQAPDAPLLVAAYVELLRRQAKDKATGPRAYDATAGATSIDAPSLGQPEGYSS